MYNILHISHRLRSCRNVSTLHIHLLLISHAGFKDFVYGRLFECCCFNRLFERCAGGRGCNRGTPPPFLRIHWGALQGFQRIKYLLAHACGRVCSLKYVWNASVASPAKDLGWAVWSSREVSEGNKLNASPYSVTQQPIYPHPFSNTRYQGMWGTPRLLSFWRGYNHLNSSLPLQPSWNATRP